MNGINIDNYETRDLAEAAVLLTMKRVLVEIKRLDGTCWFIFENRKRCEEISRQYFFDKLLVNARDFHESITRLKNRIFARE